METGTDKTGAFYKIIIMNTKYNPHAVCYFVYYHIQLTKMNKQ